MSNQTGARKKMATSKKKSNKTKRTRTTTTKNNNNNNNKKKERLDSATSTSSRLFAAVSAFDLADARASHHSRNTNRTRDDIARSKAARAQADIAATLVECRVLLQRAVTTATTATTAVTANGGQAKRRRLNEEADGNDIDDECYGETGGISEVADELLAKLLEARNRLCLPMDMKRAGPNYASLVSSGKGPIGNDGCSKHGAQDDDDNDDDDDDYRGHPPPASSLEKVLRSEYDTCRSLWKEILNRRHRDSRLHAGLATAAAAATTTNATNTTNTRFLQSVEKTFWEQVEATVARDKLMMRAVPPPAARRETGGKDNDEIDDNDDDDGDDDDNDNDNDNDNNNVDSDEGDKKKGRRARKKTKVTLKIDTAPIFDDSKVYRQLLRDFVALGAGGGGGSGGNGLHGSSNAGSAAADAAAERLRRAARKKEKKRTTTSNDNDNDEDKDVDRRASKGRKIRYTVNPKLMNFTFPISMPTPTISDDFWFRSLFGGASRLST